MTLVEETLHVHCSDLLGHKALQFGTLILMSVLEIAAHLVVKFGEEALHSCC